MFIYCLSIVYLLFIYCLSIVYLLFIYCLSIVRSTGKSNLFGPKYNCATMQTTGSLGGSPGGKSCERSKNSDFLFTCIPTRFRLICCRVWCCLEKLLYASASEADVKMMHGIIISSLPIISELNIAINE